MRAHDKLLRRTFNGAAALSAVLSVTVVAIWVRQRSVSDEFLLPIGKFGLRLHSEQGTILFGVQQWPAGPSWRSERAGIDLTSFEFGGVDGWGVMGVGVMTGTCYQGTHPYMGSPGPHPPPPECYMLALPNWLVILLAALPPAAWLRYRRRRPTKPGLCSACGYDLRATPERCPECGAVPTARA